jgi:hypothetical protein
MRKIKYSYPYMTYIHKVMERQFNHPSLHDAIRWSHTRVAPGCILHDHPRSNVVFDHWQDRGNKAYILYWRTHKDEIK